MRRASSITALGLGLTTIVALAVPASGALTAAPLGGRILPVRTPQGEVLRNVKHQVTTQNWSGYAVAKYETGSNYTSASATWVVPTAAVPPGQSAGYSSSWVGIGGFCLNSSCSKVDRSLIQLGTEQDASSSGTNYYAWWETLPQGSQLISSVAIHPGDTIVASLRDGPNVKNAKSGPGGGKGGSGGGKGQSWTLSLTDTTTGYGWSDTMSYDSSLASAEWIEEAPYSGGILPLADFGTATFDLGYANGVSPGLAQSNGIVMMDPNGQTSNISLPDSDFDGFNACWGDGTSLASCSQPASS